MSRESGPDSAAPLPPKLEALLPAPPPESSTDRQRQKAARQKAARRPAREFQKHLADVAPLPAAGCPGPPAAGPGRLPRRALELLRALGFHRLVRPRHLREPGWEPSHKGVLDLYSGSGRFAKQMIRRGAEWVLTVDWLADPIKQDLLSPTVREELEDLISAGAFVCVGAGPICSSFSRAVRPPVRNRAHLRGIPGITPNMQIKVAQGNEHSDWMAKVVRLALSHKLWFWVENPDSSWLWAQSCWCDISMLEGVSVFRTDFCRWGMPWRKRTRFLTNIPDLAGKVVFCTGCKQHIILKGTSPWGGLAWTKVAEPYPPGLADALGRACARASSMLRAAPLDLERSAAAACRRWRSPDAATQANARQIRGH